MSAPDKTHWAMPREELLELLETTRDADAPPLRLRVTTDRRQGRRPSLPDAQTRPDHASAERSLVPSA